MKLLTGIVIVLLSGFVLPGLHAQTEQTLKDADGNVYKTIAIGKQIWMAENLKTTKYNDGTAIPNMADSLNLLDSIPSYHFYNNDIANKTIYGLMYNWYVVGTNKLCPYGWHVPTTGEWTILSNALGGESAAGGKLKESGTKHWEKPNTGATNETGFTALPGGYRSIWGAFEGIGSYCAWWSATNFGNAGAYIRTIGYNNSKLYWNVPSKSCDHNVRCVKD